MLSMMCTFTALYPPHKGKLVEGQLYAKQTYVHLIACAHVCLDSNKLLQFKFKVKFFVQKYSELSGKLFPQAP